MRESPSRSSTTPGTPSWSDGQKYRAWRGRQDPDSPTSLRARPAHCGRCLLPYGEYILHESATNESMLLTAPDQTVLVEDDGIIYEFTMADEVVRGGVLDRKARPGVRAAHSPGRRQLGRHPVRNHQQERQRRVCGRRALPARRGVCHHRGGGRHRPDGRPALRPTAPTRWWSPSLGRATSTRTRPCALSRFGEMGRSVEYRDGDAAYNQVIRGDLQFVKVGEGGEANMRRFANVAFKLISARPLGEEATFVM